ncbi:hypothetical protein [Mangrovimonas sp. YM274]|uniref:hypothetical protein n=1 Tax=Mangrovimonas sp. YM274 TaxID=3070660 RepID=UPI0027DD5E96|nr:hypothetical protein [Mangrovimonas sp. YM274]WMI68846.1 hypothetical protein RBH95_00420 [Mangrovimonas sp. YM274]
MKRAIKNSILMVALIAAMSSYANTNISSIEMKAAKRTMLTLEDVKQGQKLMIRDLNGMVLYKETISNSGTYSNLFDLTELPNGNYFFEIDKDVAIEIIPFKVQAHEVEFSKQKETKFYKPIFRVENNKIMFSKLDLELAPIEVDIYYDDSYDHDDKFETIHSETIKNEKVVERIYKLDNSRKGDYKIVVSTQGREFTHSMKI